MAKHILYIEDNPGDARLLEEALRTCGLNLRLHLAENAVQAFDFLARRGRFHSAPQPDLVLLDLALPVISGSEVLDAMRRNLSWRGLPVIVLSSSTSSAEIDRRGREGGLCHVVKPANWQHYQELAIALDHFLHDGTPLRATERVRVLSPRRVYDASLGA